jgi:hypothetical protein
MEEPGMGGEDDTLSGLAQPQAIINIVEGCAKMRLVHSAHMKIVSATGDKAGGGNGAAFMGNTQEIQVSGLVNMPVLEGVHRAGLGSQNDTSMLNDAAREGQ